MPVVRRVLASLVAVAALAALAACAPDDGPPAPSARATTPAPTGSSTSTEPPTPAPTDSPATEPGPAEPRVRRVPGIDVSHHQGEIDWERVAATGVRFAYLKATEGSGFSDPRFADHWAAASRAGLRVGGYHYFTLCGDPLTQADHYVRTLEAQPPVRRPLAPVVDLELIGSCDPSPDPATMRAAVTAFVEEVERRTGRRVVVYTHPDFDERYDFVAGLDRRRWVRRPGDVAPPGDWLIWQRSDDGRVDGIDGPVDLDVMRVVGG